jgi:hypothetical protein
MGARITQTNLTTNPTHQRNHTHDRATSTSESAADQSTAAAPVEPTAPPRQLLPAAPTQMSEKAASLPLATAQRATTPPGGLSRVFLGRSLRAWSLWVRVACSRVAAPRSRHAQLRMAARGWRLAGISSDHLQDARLDLRARKSRGPPPRVAP